MGTTSISSFFLDWHVWQNPFTVEAVESSLGVPLKGLASPQITMTVCRDGSFPSADLFGALQNTGKISSTRIAAWILQEGP